jgi:hypothetical protein
MRPTSRVISADRLPASVVSATLEEMKKLRVAGRALVKNRVAALNRDHLRRATPLRRQASGGRAPRADRASDRAIDPLLCAHLAADPALNARFDILVGIPGVGEAAASLAGSLPSPAIPASAAASGSSAAGARRYARRSTCQPSWPSASMRRRRPNTTPSFPPESHQTGPDRHHAKDHHPGRRPRPTRQGLDSETRLIKTDTLALLAEAQHAARPVMQLERGPGRYWRWPTYLSACNRALSSRTS